MDVIIYSFICITPTAQMSRTRYFVRAEASPAVVAA